MNYKLAGQARAATALPPPPPMAAQECSPCFQKPNNQGPPQVPPRPRQAWYHILLARAAQLHAQDGHGDQPQHVGEHQLLVDAEVEPGVVGEQRGGLALGGEEEREDADHRRHARHVVRRLPVCKDMDLL